MGLINKEIPSIPKQKIHEFLWLICGRNKTGKTSLASQFPEPYFFTFEPGTSALLTYETDILKTANKNGVHPWKVYKKAVNEFIENDGYGFKTVVTDPYGRAYEKCEEFVCDREGIEDPGDLEWGKGYRLVRKEFKKVTNKLISHDFTVVFITHTKAKNMKDGAGNEKDKIDLDISGQAGDFIRNLVDIFLLADFDEEGNRKLFVRPTSNQEAGSRLDFGTTTIDLNYESLKEAFKEAVEKNNEKQGVTQEMIEKHYERKEQEQKLLNVRDQIIEKAQSIGMTPSENTAEMEEVIGCSSVKDIDSLEKAKKYLDHLNDKE